MGLVSSAAALTSETGQTLEDPSATSFRKAILGGQWDTALSALDSLKPRIKKIAKINNMKFAIFEQKFLELLEEGDCLAAFQCLRFDLGTTYLRKKNKIELTFYNQNIHISL